MGNLFNMPPLSKLYCDGLGKCILKSSESLFDYRISERFAVWSRDVHLHRTKKTYHYD